MRKKFLIIFFVFLVSCHHTDDYDWKANNSPLISSKLSQDVVGIGELFTLKVYVTDPDTDSISVKIDWGDGNCNEWTSYNPSGETLKFYYKYFTAGIYEITIEAKDEYGYKDRCQEEIRVNRSPSIPETPYAQDMVNPGDRLEATTRALDPDGDKVAIKILWDDGDTSDWSDFVESGELVTLYHVYNEPGVYYIRAKASDIWGFESGWSGFRKIIVNREPKIPETPSAPDSAYIGESIVISSSTTDPDGNPVSIRFDFGNGDTSNWSDFVESGEIIYVSYTYKEAGTFYIRAQAKDEFNAKSEWSGSCKIIIK